MENGLMSKERMKKMQSFTIYQLQNLQNCQTMIKKELNMDKSQDIKIITSLLFEHFKKIALNSEETASIIGRSEDYLKKDREEAIGIPFTRVNGKERGKPLYNITAIAKALVQNEKRVF